jgi:hypothetical protein
MANISTASGEEETCAKPFFLGVFVGGGAGDGGLSSSSHAVQPEDTSSTTSIGPRSYLIKDLDAVVGEAKSVVLAVVRVEGCLSRVW